MSAGNGSNGRNGRNGILYDRLSSYYELVFRWVSLPRQRALLRTVNFKPGARILDIGVGTGIALSMYPKNCRVTGVDVSRPMLDLARRKIANKGLKNIELFEMDAHKIDSAFPPQTFDYVVAAFVMSVFSDPVKVLKNLKSVAKHDGLILIVNRIKGENGVLTKGEKLLEPICCKIGWHTALEMDKVLGEAGFRIVKQKPCFPYDLFTIVHASNGIDKRAQTQD